MLGSLVGQDFGKLMVASLCVLGSIAATLVALNVPVLGDAGKWLVDLFTIR